MPWLSAIFVPEIDRLLTVQTPAELFESFRTAAPVGEGLVVAGYWAAVLPLAREIVQDVGGSDVWGYTSAVNAALQNNGLASIRRSSRRWHRAARRFSTVLPTEGAFRLTSGNDTLWLGSERHAVFAGAGNDFVAVAYDSAQAQHLDGGSGNDHLLGGSANDWFDGESALTRWWAELGTTLTVDNAGDVVTEVLAVARTMCARR